MSQPTSIKLGELDIDGNSAVVSTSWYRQKDLAEHLSEFGISDVYGNGEILTCSQTWTRNLVPDVMLTADGWLQASMQCLDHGLARDCDFDPSQHAPGLDTDSEQQDAPSFGARPHARTCKEAAENRGLVAAAIAALRQRNSSMASAAIHKETSRTGRLETLAHYHPVLSGKGGKGGPVPSDSGSQVSQQGSQQ